MSNQYVAWVSITTGVAFFNPVSILGVAIGDVVNDHTAVAIGELDAIQAVIDAINATLAPAISFESLLAG